MSDGTISRLYTKDFSELKKSNRIALVVASISLAVSLVALYPSLSSKDILAKNAKCAQDGADWVAQNIKDISPDFIVGQNYTYSTELQTCLVDIQQDTSMGMFYDIYDIYLNKDIASYSIPNPKIGLSATVIGSQKEYLATKKRYFSK